MKNLDLGFEFLIVTEVNDVVAALAGAPLTTQRLGMTGSRNDASPIITYE